MPDLKFTKGTDQEHKIKLDSILISLGWKAASAYAGRTIGFEVRTSFVGQGAEINVTGKSAKGKKLGKVKGAVFANSFIGKFLLPVDMEMGDEIQFEADLPQNGLNDKSEKIPVFPVPKIEILQWSAKEAHRGDVLTLTAELKDMREGADAVVTIYEYDRNSAHDRIVEFPTTVKSGKIEICWAYEYHEDTDEIPSAVEKEKYGGAYNPPEYFFTVKVDNLEFGNKQESGLLTFKDWIEIELIAWDGKPVANEDYEIILPDGTSRKGVLDAMGHAVERDIPPGVCKVDFPNAKGFGGFFEDGN
ncbi:MAG: hypothetical protein MIO92_04950 [Methanosarcinaceae archaeon]|nr:hypothetical protein [Methanosarcinaceae archaeon]